MRYNFFSNSVTLLMVLLLDFSGYSQCSRSIGYNSTFFGPCDFQRYSVNQPILACWEWGDDKKIKHIEYSVYQISGFEDNTNCPVTSQPRVYHAVRSCSSYKDNNELCHEFSLCPRTGEFRLEVKVALRGNLSDDCPRDGVVTTIYFTILPDSEMPVPIDGLITTVCPNTTGTYMEVSDQPSGQDGVNWYNGADCGITGHEPYVSNSYKYEVFLGVGEVKEMYPSYFKEYSIGLTNFEGIDTYQTKYCFVNGRRMINSAIGAELHLQEIPDPITRLVCSDNSVSLFVDNPVNKFDGVLWYEEVNGVVPIHDGFKYTASFDKPLTQLYIEYYKDLGDNCRQTSLSRSLVSVINLKEISDQAYDLLDFGANTTELEISDHRYISNTIECNESGQENKYWIDLEGNVSAAVESLDEALEIVINSIPWPTSIVNVEASFSNQYWRAYDRENRSWVTNGIYFEDFNRKIVCSDYVCDKDEVIKGKRKRQFQKLGMIRLNYSYKDPETGKVVPKEAEFCGEKLIARVNVMSKIPQSTGTQYCSEIDQNTVQEIEALQGIYLECDNSQTLTVCPDQVTEIGPMDSEVAAMFVAKGGVYLPGVPYVSSYEWNPKTGVFGEDEQNPMLDVERMEYYSGNFAKYINTITFIDGKRARFCTVLYKCAKCGDVETPDMGNELPR